MRHAETLPLGYAFNVDGGVLFTMTLVRFDGWQPPRTVASRAEPVLAPDPSRSIAKSCSCNDLRRTELAEGER